MRVVKIEPGQSKTLAEMEPEIKKSLTLERAKQEIRKLRDKVDEEIGGGARLDEVGKKLNLPVRAVEEVDRSGRDPKGQVVELPKGADVLGGLFKTEIGIENDALQTPDGGLVWYDLVAITRSDRPVVRGDPRGVDRQSRVDLSETQAGVMGILGEHAVGLLRLLLYFRR